MHDHEQKEAMGMRFTALVTAALVAGAASLAGTASAAEAVSVRLKWVAQAQFAGFYVAKEKGFYAAEGLDVTVNPGGPNLNGETLVASGADQFALAGGIENLLASRGKGLPIVGIAMMLQRTPSAYVAFNDSGIRSPKDFKGKKVSTFFTGAHNTLYAVLSKFDVGAADVTVVPQAVSMAPFIDRQIDVATVMLFNELNVLKTRGVKDFTVFRAEDYGVSFPSDTVIVNEKLIAERPQTVQAFLNGSMRGWKYAAEHQEEAVDIVLKAASGLDRAHQLAMLAEYSKLMVADLGTEKGIGVLDMTKLGAVRQSLVDRKVLDAGVQVGSALAPRFWDAVPTQYKKP
ncbi:MAG: ABC transporter substrate-binding protein [Alphaproteobacteria bacterium]|nr:ABC transporter substrate-binding protein [Alphaproteobacteria bacterium]